MSLSKKAKTLYNSGRYKEARDLYIQLSELTSSDTFLYNAKLCEKMINKSSKIFEKSGLKESSDRDKKNIISTENSAFFGWKTKPDSKYELKAVINISSRSKEKQLLALIDFAGKNGEPVNPSKDKSNLSWSTIYKKYFFYIENKESSFGFSKILTIPPGVHSISLEIKSFSLSRGEAAEITHPQLDSFSEKITLNHYIRNQAPVNHPKYLKVAMVCDPFTFHSFKNDFSMIIINPDNWEEQFIENNPDVFFCESTWTGCDITNAPWQGKVYASSSFKHENRTALLNILNYCRKNDIPTIFWNKEDPSHYSDRFTDFVRTAQEFDFVFTTAEECVNQYKHDIRKENIFVLPFAVNPQVFNPITNLARTKDIIFAGSWYKTHPLRCSDTVKILQNLTNEGFNLKIYDRYHGSTDNNRCWPQQFRKYIHPGRPSSDMPIIYKESEYALNLNTVKDSKSMFARRVFELMASNTLVLSNSSLGMDNIFPELFVNVETNPSLLASMNSDEINTMKRNAMTEVLSKHTYTNRWIDILKTIGAHVSTFSNQFTLCIVVSNLEDVAESVKWHSEHDYGHKSLELCIVANKSFPNEDMQVLYSRYNDQSVTVTSYAHMHKYATEAYQPLQTEYFAITKAEKLRQINLYLDIIYHAQYVKQCLIHPAGNIFQRYTFAQPPQEPSMYAGSFPLFKDALIALEDGFIENQEIYYA